MTCWTTSGVVAAALLAAPLAAQTPAPAKATDSSSVLVFDHLFETGVLEHIPVFLQKGVRYRAVLDHPGVQLQLYTSPGVEPPFLTLVAQDVDAETRLVYEIYPHRDGDVEFRVIGGEAGAATRVQVWHDVAPAVPKPVVVAGPVPLELGAEIHSGVRFGESGPYGNQAGAIASVCIATRNSPRIFERFGGAAICIEHEDDAAVDNISEFFIEPRFRIHGDPAQSGRRVEIDFFLRVGARWSTLTEWVGPDNAPYIARVRKARVFGAIGLSADWKVSRGARGAGWWLLSRFLPAGPALTLGVGRYFQ
ncbi:MAG: hypothetical protein ACHQXA_06935 [Gemmatimonadales bacterium]